MASHLFIIMADHLFGTDATLTQLFKRVLGFATPEGVKIPDVLEVGPAIPGEKEEQGRMAGNRFQKDVGMPDSQMQTRPGEEPNHRLLSGPVHREIDMSPEAEEDRARGRKGNMKRRIQNSPRLHPGTKEEAIRLLEDDNTEMLRQLLFPGGAPGVAT